MLVLFAVSGALAFAGLRILLNAECNRWDRLYHWED
jgi:hypothetical protein